MLRSPTLPRAAALLLSLSAAPSGAAALSETKTVHESSEVSLVQVPVWVTGRDGRPVRGLSAREFEVEDEGVRQKIEAVDVVDLREKGVDEVGSRSSAAHRHFLLLFDLSYATPAAVIRSREAAVRFLTGPMDPDDLASVATISAEQGARLLVTFTSDRRQLVAAIRTLGLTGAFTSSGDPLAFAFAIPGDPELAKLSIGDQSGPRTPADLAGALKILSMAARRSGDQFAISRVSRQLGGMSQLAKALDLVSGRKIVVYFSEGFDGRLLVGDLHRSPLETSAENDAMAQGQFWQIDVDKRYVNTPLQKQLSETLALFRRSDCVVYPVDIGGLRSESNEPLGDLRYGEESLFAIAQETGGEVFANPNDLDVPLRRIAERSSVTYLVVFRPTLRLGEGAFHRLRVRVRSPGARISARAGYYETRRFSRLSALERALSAAELVRAEKDEGFPMDVLVLPIRGGPTRVPVVIEIPAREIRPTGEAVGRLDLYVYGVNERGEVEDYFSRAVRFDAAAHGTGPTVESFRYRGSLHLPPGRHRIRTLARNGETGRYAVRAVVVDVPEPSATRLATLPPLFLAAPDAVGKDLAGQAPGSLEPFVVGGRGFTPRLRPSLASGESTGVCLMLYRADPGSGSAGFQVKAAVLDPRGGTFSPDRFAIVGRSSPDATGLIKLLLEFAPPQLQAGDYSLRVTVREPATGETTQAEAAFRVR